MRKFSSKGISEENGVGLLYICSFTLCINSMTVKGSCPCQVAHDIGNYINQFECTGLRQLGIRKYSDVTSIYYSIQYCHTSSYDSFDLTYIVYLRYDYVPFSKKKKANK